MILIYFIISITKSDNKAILVPAGDRERRENDGNDTWSYGPPR